MALGSSGSPPYLGSCLLSLSLSLFLPLVTQEEQSVFLSLASGGLLPPMESYWDVPLQGVLPAAYPPEKSAPSTGSKFEELFPGDSNMEEEDASQEWLSIFLEECLSNTTYCITTSPTLALPNQQASISPSSTNPRHPNSQNPKSNLEQGLVFPTKASRTKRRRVTPGATHPFANHTFHVTPPDLPLLPQDYWLAESELIILEKEQKEEPAEATTAVPVEGWKKGRTKVGETQTRKCSHCLSQKTPQWRAGPLGPKTLCNACGVRFKSGRLLPEYRPAKSPTFVNYKHSNSHKKVLEMRMNILPSS